MGDLNLDLVKIGLNSKIDLFMDILYGFYLEPLISSPTRITATSATLLDNIFTNVNICTHSGILISDVSDHLPIFCMSSSIAHCTNKSPPIYVKRNITQSNMIAFLTH